MTFGLSWTAGVLALALALPAEAVPKDEVSFDWSVPARYGPDGMIGVELPVTDSPDTLRVLNPEASVGDAAPAGWPADFTACARKRRFVKYTWSVDGQEVFSSRRCTARITFPREGVYTVELTAVRASGARTTTSQEVNIQDWLIIGFGDSYGSGEGVPNLPSLPKKFEGLEAARTEAEKVAAEYQQALAAVATAQAAVEAARQELAAVRGDLDELSAAWNEFLRATQALAEARKALTAATTALAKATAAVAAAVAKVAFECAQWWDPAGCNAALARLARARDAEATAKANRERAVAAHDTAQQDLARAVAALPQEGFDYARGVLEARVALLRSRLDVATVALQGVQKTAAKAQVILKAALGPLSTLADGLKAHWQDSVRVSGRLIDHWPYFELPHRYSQCHQSKFSGQALAALQIEKDDPKTSVTFIHLACSGATVTKGLLEDGDGLEQPRSGDIKPPPQVERAAYLAGGREVDAFVTSIGGNDVGFAKLIQHCVLREPCYLPNPERLSDAEIDVFCGAFQEGQEALGAVLVPNCQDWMRDGRDLFKDAEGDFFNKLDDLPGLYAQVQERIQEFWPGLPADRMFLTQYPMVTRDHKDALCGFEQDPRTNMPFVTTGEILWAEQVVAASLNRTIEDQEAALGWTVVKGIDEAFRLHGYCSDSGWLVRIRESLRKQLGPTGIAHPNDVGHRAYAVKIGAALRKAFYPQSKGSVLGPSRVDGHR